MVPPKLNLVPQHRDTEDEDGEAGNASASNVSAHPSSEKRENLRILEALLFAASEPLDEKTLGASLKGGADLPALIEELRSSYQARGVNRRNSCQGRRRTQVRRRLRFWGRGRIRMPVTREVLDAPDHQRGPHVV